MIGVYKIINLQTNKIYVGSSVDIEGRWKQHKKLLLKNKHHSIRLQIISMYGIKYCRTMSTCNAQFKIT